MRRLASIAAFVVLLALPLWAQHGGGGHSGGGGFGGHGGAFAGGGHALSGGTHSSSSFSSSSSSSFSSSPSGVARSGVGRGYAHSPSFSQPLTRGFSNRGLSNRGGVGLRLRTYGFRNNCRGYGCWGYGYPWAYGGYYDPYWWGSSDSSNEDSYQQDLANANEMNQQSLDQQNQQQQMLQQEQADGDRDIYARSDPRASGQPQGTAILPATVLVFRDQHQQEIQNYAIVGQTLWNFAPQRTQKIPLSELDLPATEKANDDRGLTFKVPASNEGQ
jgi:hypothetical protein